MPKDAKKGRFGKAQPLQNRPLKKHRQRKKRREEKVSYS
jgi:hypothetical protein